MAKLGTSKKPAVVRVQTQKKAAEIVASCDKHGIKVIVGIEPDKPEDISDVERVLNPSQPIRIAATVNRNDPCPCGSGKKYKKCCMNKSTTMNQDIANKNNHIDPDFYRSIDNNF